MDIRNDGATGLTSIWIEIPPFCHLQCGYCYTGASRDMQKEPEGMLARADYRRIIDEFAAMGGKEIGIPGRGEPFHPRNEALVRELIDYAYGRGVTTMLFSTGETLFYTKEGRKETPYVRRGSDDLVRFLISREVLLFVKYNSRRPEVQDRLVDLDGYTVRRNEALDLLISKYKLNELRKLGVATSCMEANADELPGIYEFAKANGLVFDCDTVLPQGRGAQYVKANAFAEEKYLRVSAEIRRREKATGHPGGTYMTSSCDRIKRHIYIDFRGDGYPCLGAAGKIPLGNIRKVSLRDMWESPVRRKLRTDRKVFTGVCARCGNFIDEECHSCLSRAVEDVTADGSSGTLELLTRGCMHHRPRPALWTGAVREYLEAALRQAVARRRDGLEKLWDDNRNMAYVLSLLKAAHRRELLAAFAVGKDPAENDAEFRHALAAAEAFSRKTEYDQADLQFPLNAVWKFISGREAQETAALFPGDILANATIPSVRLLFRDHPETSRMFLAFRFRDPAKGTVFTRLFANAACRADSAGLFRALRHPGGDPAFAPARHWTAAHPGSGSRLEVWTDAGMGDEEQAAVREIFAAITEPLDKTT